MTPQLLSAIRAKNLGEDPETAFPLRNENWVGVSGEGAGRIYAPSAYLAIVKGVTAYVPRVGDLDNIHELQPNWALDDVAAGESKSQAFVLHGAPLLAAKAKTTFSVESAVEPVGVRAAPASWFKLPKSVTTSANSDAPFTLSLNVPAGAAPGTYAATVVAEARIAKNTVQKVRIPVQFFVTATDSDPAAGAGSAIEGPIWASELTDYSIIGFEDPLGDIHTDWVSFPVRLTGDVDRLDLSVYDVAGVDHMDIFVFDENGQEVDSTVTPFLDHAVPGGALYTPTTQSDPNTVSILDGDDLGTVVAPATVWVMVSDSGPDQVGFSTFHLDIDLVGGGGGNTPAERIHSGAHAWWSGSVGGADSHMTRSVTLPANASSLKFWTWYNLEDGFDWAYALVSTDGGATWTSLATSAANGSGTTTLDPIGDSGGVLGGNKKYPNGFTGVSGVPAFTGQGVVNPVYTEQTADISAYAGKSVLLRFAYSSDPATNLENFYLDDVLLLDSTGGTVLSDDMETQGTWVPGGNPGFSWVTADA